MRHHVLAASLSAGIAQGSYPGRGFYYTGGFADSAPQDIVVSNVRQSSFVLRGYEPGRFVGRQYQLGNLEYRFPLLYPERGLATLPLFFRTLSGAVFADYGGAFNEIDPADVLAGYHLGVGAELWLDLTFAYSVPLDLRLGAAKGFGEEAASGLQTYFVMAAAF